MKKLLLIALMAFVGVSAQAQSEKGDMAAGINVASGIKNGEYNMGLGAKFQYNITNGLRAEASGTYYFKKDYVTMWDANVNLHYLFNITNKLQVYPVVGLAVIGASVDWKGLEKDNPWDDDSDDSSYWEDADDDAESTSSSKTNVGCNLGGGVQYWVAKNIAVNLEAKYVFAKDLDRTVVQLGCVYKF